MDITDSTLFPAGTLITGTLDITLPEPTSLAQIKSILADKFHLPLHALAPEPGWTKNSIRLIYNDGPHSRLVANIHIIDHEKLLQENKEQSNIQLCSAISLALALSAGAIALYLAQ
jgi:hypothetical protein